MKKYIMVFILSLLISPGFAQSPVFDFSGVDNFWPVMESLLSDHEPAESQWQKLLSSPGLQVGALHEFTESWIKKYYRLAFMPSMEEARQEISGFNNFYNSYWQHLRELPARRKIIEKEVEMMKADDSYSREAISLCREYLPPRAIDQIDPPTISFMFFGPDFRGYENILMDFAYFLDIGDERIPIMAHEMHHYYEKSYSVIRDGEDELIWLMKSVYIEGLADQINKSPWIDSGKIPEKINETELQRLEKYKEYLMDVPVQILVIDSLFRVISQTKGSMAMEVSLMRKSIPQSGHPTGYFMARAIRETLGKDKLISNFGSPFGFFLTYQKVAVKSGNYPVFSDETISFIEALERKYNFFTVKFPS